MEPFASTAVLADLFLTDWAEATFHFENGRS